MNELYSSTNQDEKVSEVVVLGNSIYVSITYIYILIIVL